MIRARRAGIESFAGPLPIATSTLPSRRPMALPALPAPARTRLRFSPDDVVALERVAQGTMSLLGECIGQAVDVSTLHGLVSHVVGLSAEKEMRGVAAWRIVASMKHSGALGNGPVFYLPSQSVCSDDFTRSNSKRPIPVSGTSGPGPAGVGPIASVNFLNEAGQPVTGIAVVILQESHRLTLHLTDRRSAPSCDRRLLAAPARTQHGRKISAAQAVA